MSGTTGTPGEVHETREYDLGGGLIAREARRYRKDGRPRTRWEWEAYYRYTSLRRCDFCGLISTPRRIPDWAAWAMPWPYCRELLPIIGMCAATTRNRCWACYNRMKPIDRFFNDVIENRRMLKRLEREIAGENRERRATAGLPVGRDGAT